MIHRLEETGLTRREIAAGSNVASSAITRLANLTAQNPTLRVVAGVRKFYRERCPEDVEPPRQQRFANGCAPRAGR
nr:XRE family transcriptional regulator [Sinorhizobium meliloti]